VSIRTKVLTTALGFTIVMAIGLQTFFVWKLQQARYRDIEMRARAFLAMLSVSLLEPLSKNDQQGIDAVVAGVAEQDLEVVDIAYVTVLDNQREVLAHTDASLFGTVLRDPFSLLATGAPDTVVREEKDLLLVSKPIMTRVHKNPPIRWGTAIVAIRLQKLREEYKSALMRLLLGSVGISLLLVLIVGWMLQKIVVEPINKLHKVASAFTVGDYSARVVLKTHDEMEGLADTFNEMAREIESHTRHLEETIRDRTRELEEANRKLRELATTDGLTGLYNYRFFEDTIRMEVRRAQRQKLPLSMLMIDLDHFKVYNDTHGHQMGDEVLKTLARIMKYRLRSTDFPCRYGGEEFAIILPGTGFEEAMSLAEEIRGLVEAHPFSGGERQPEGRLTISIGVATYPQDAEDEISLVRTADMALYRAKQKGRNRVEGPAEV
jgi:diguanylate cyclase (GGDEF)-like protein